VDGFVAYWKHASPGTSPDDPAFDVDKPTFELLARVLRFDQQPTDEFAFTSPMGDLEIATSHALQTLWLCWREELIADGVTAPRAVWSALRERERRWLAEPSPTNPALSRVAAIERERDEFQAHRRRAAGRRAVAPTGRRRR
jgi:hypothetical protein